MKPESVKTPADAAAYLRFILTKPERFHHVYIGRRDANGNTAGVHCDGQALPLYLDEVNHSPDGFEWGYGGSGPSQLAYALCRMELGPKVAQWVYQNVKWATVARLDQDGGFRLTTADLHEAFQEEVARLEDWARHVQDLEAEQPEPLEDPMADQ